MCSIGCFRRYYSVLIWIQLDHFSAADIAGEIRGYELAIHILIHYVFFLFGQSAKRRNCSVYLYYLYIVLFNWFYDFLTTQLYLNSEKIRKRFADRFLDYTIFVLF